MRGAPSDHRYGDPVRIGLVCPYSLSVPGGVQGQVRQVAQVAEAAVAATNRAGERLQQQLDGIEATRRIAAQTRQRITGLTPDGATRLVSLHDPDARPIAKGRLGKPVEFGHKAQVCDNDDGIVLDHDVQPGNPADAPRLRLAVERVKKRTGRTPQTVAADRGYGEQAVEDALHDLGVKQVVIPRKGRPGKTRQAHERQRTFRRHVKWRTGCEGRISHLKRSYGWDRTRIDTTEGARTWIGQGVFAHNLTKIATLTA